MEPEQGGPRGTRRSGEAQAEHRAPHEVASGGEKRMELTRENGGFVHLLEL